MQDPPAGAPSTPPPPAQRRSPWLPVLLGGLLPAALLGATIWWWYGRAPAPVTLPPSSAAAAASEESGANLLLPEDFKTDRSFLEGLWRTRTDLFYGDDTHQVPIELYYRLDSAGRGELIVHRDGAPLCQGPVTVANDNQSLVFRMPKPVKCSDGLVINPVDVSCRRLPDGAAACEGINSLNRKPFTAEIERADRLP